MSVRINLFKKYRQVPSLEVGAIVIVRYHDAVEQVKVMSESKRSTRHANQYLVKRAGRLYNCCQNLITKEWELYRD